MAEVVPFKGILYNPEKIGDFSDVIAPPYDVISPKEQEQFHRRHPNNVIRLILGRIYETDDASDNRYTRAAGYLETWLKEKVLVRDQAPAFYLNSVKFPVEGREVVRYALVALVRLEPFEKGIVLPHEKTFSKVRSERLEVMKACHANFSPIFSLYSDNNGILSSLKQAAEGKTPDMEMTDSNGFEQKLWRILEPAVHQKISESMADKTIYIADGHHRYETALSYREWVAENTPDFTDRHPANYILMSLSSMEDPGLVILPAHRILSQVGDEILESFQEKAEKYFHVDVYDCAPSEIRAAADRFSERFQAEDVPHCIGVFMKKDSRFLVMKLKEGVMEDLFAGEVPEALLDLDVTVLTRLIFMELLGFDQQRLDNDKLIAYSTRIPDAVEIAAEGDYDAVFILKPTRMEQVRRVAEQGLIMPRKSTYFFPKVISGHVLNNLVPDQKG